MAERRPLVGITTYVEPARWAQWQLDAALIPLAYVRALDRAGARPLLVPPVEGGVEETLDALDGLLLSGGADLDPATYGAEPHPATANVRPERDRAELALLEAALARDLPVLAVCRGSQILNVARGGDLVQHLPEVIGSEAHRETPGVFSEHDVSVEEESRLRAIVGAHTSVKSSHHQGFGRVGEGLRPAAWADDGTLEALGDPAHPFALGVLWHPEEGEDLTLFEALVDAARTYREERGR